MTYRTIALDQLSLSKTAAQLERRKHLDKIGLEELTESVKTAGVINAILVRPLANGDAEHFEIVAGERRFLAAQAAGLTEIPSTVRELTDQQVIELQLIENLQRQGLHELAEAEGYEALQVKHGYTIEDLVAKVGKSKAYVYARLKLLSLSKDSRAAFYSGDLSASTALLLARLHNADDQKQMLKVAMKGPWGNGEPMSFRELKRYIGEEVMLQLKRAPFDTSSGDLVPKAGPCTTCPKRSGNQVELFDDSESADLCTDSGCFRSKRAAAIKIKADAARAEGKTVLSAKESAGIFQTHSDQTAWNAKYKALDETEYTGRGNAKIRSIIPKDAETVHAIAPSGALVEVVKKSVVDKAIARARSKPAKSKQSSPSASNKKVDLEQAVLDRVYIEILKKRPARLSLHELRLALDAMATMNAGFRSNAPNFSKMARLGEAAVHSALFAAIYDDLAAENPKAFLEAAARMRINVDAIRKELTPAPAKAAAKKPAKKK